MRTLCPTERGRVSDVEPRDVLRIWASGLSDHGRTRSFRFTGESSDADFGVNELRDVGAQLMLRLVH